MKNEYKYNAICVDFDGVIAEFTDDINDVGLIIDGADYNTPQKLDKGLRWMITCRNLEEGRQDEKEKKVRCDIQG